MTDELKNHDLHLLLVEIRAEVRATRDAVEKHLKDDTAIHADHEDRLRKTERGLWTLGGMGALVAVLATYFEFLKGS